MKRAMEEKLTRAYRRAYDKNQLKSRSTRSAADEDEEEQDVLMFPHGRHMRSAHETGPPHTHQGTFWQKPVGTLDTPARTYFISGLKSRVLKLTFLT